MSVNGPAEHNEGSSPRGFLVNPGPSVDSADGTAAVESRRTPERPDYRNKKKSNKHFSPRSCPELRQPRDPTLRAAPDANDSN